MFAFEIILMGLGIELSIYVLNIPIILINIKTLKFDLMFSDFFYSGYICWFECFHIDYHINERFLPAKPYSIQEWVKLLFLLGIWKMVKALVKKCV